MARRWVPEIWTILDGCLRYGPSFQKVAAVLILEGFGRNFLFLRELLTMLFLQLARRLLPEVGVYQEFAEGHASFTSGWCNLHTVKPAMSEAGCLKLHMPNLLMSGGVDMQSLCYQRMAEQARWEPPTPIRGVGGVG